MEKISLEDIINFQPSENEQTVVLICGSSGCGKTWLSNALLDLWKQKYQGNPEFLEFHQILKTPQCSEILETIYKTKCDGTFDECKVIHSSKKFKCNIGKNGDLTVIDCQSIPCSKCFPKIHWLCVGNSTNWSNVTRECLMITDHNFDDSNYKRVDDILENVRKSVFKFTFAVFPGGVSNNGPLFMNL